MELIDLLGTINFKSFDSAVWSINGIKYTLILRGIVNLQPTLHGSWEDYVVRNCTVLNKNRVSAGLASIDMLMSFTVNGAVYAMEIIISDAVSNISAVVEEVAPVVLQLDDVAIEIDAVVDNGKQLHQRARRSKGSK